MCQWPKALKVVSDRKMSVVFEFGRLVNELVSDFFSDASFYTRIAFFSRFFGNLIILHYGRDMALKCLITDAVIKNYDHC